MRELRWTLERWWRQMLRELWRLWCALVWWRRGYHPCEHPGCRNEGAQCYYPNGDILASPDAWYCGLHAHRAGFCKGCGQFWGGVESFEFNRQGLCDDCQMDEDSEGERGDEPFEDDWEDDREEEASHA